MKKKLTFLALTLILILSVCATTVFATTETASLKITAANLSLENAVYMNFKVTHENIDRDDVKLLVWEEMPEAYTKGTEDTCLSAKTDKDGNTFFHYTDLTAKDMTKLVYACAYAKIDGVEYYSAPIKYSIVIYAHRMKASSTDAKLLELIDSMLEYGALAQKYFNYKTDDLATAPLYQISVNGGKLEDGFAIGWYHEGATATLTANEAEEGYIFSHWTNSEGYSVSINSILTVTVNNAETYKAVYRLLDAPLPSDPETSVYSKGLEYTLSDDGTYYTVSSIGICEDTEIIIPTFYNDLPVQKIGEYAFSGCENITNITIPVGVTSIDSGAFYYCTNLSNITIPAGVVSIGEGAFYGCTNLTNISLPEGLTTIGAYAFEDCVNLESITLPKGVTSIGDWTFENCTSLTGITMYDGITSIGNRAFYNCTSLTSITIPEGVTSIGEYAFYRCTKLASVKLPSTIQSIPQYTFYGCSSLTDITLPKSITTIGTYGFYNCASLTSIVIPEGVTSIGSSAFEDCTSLASVKLPSTIDRISSYMFYGCSSLTTITIPEGVTLIDDRAFYYCTNLTSMVIPTSVKYINYWTTSKNIKKIYYTGTSKEWSSISINVNNNISSATIYYYSATHPTTNGNYWHYAGGKPITW